MPKNARDKPKPAKPKPVVPVIKEKPWEKRLPRSKESGNPNIPIRTVLYVEVGDMPPQEVHYLIKQIIGHYAENEHPHYVLPVRRRQIGPEVMFEEEWLNVVNLICEVNDDGEIVLKGGAREVDVIRKKV
jgi:hypothetical protein